MKKCIVFTGGGTAGHVTPNLALMAHFQQEGWDMHYIGAETGVEKELVANRGVHWHAVQCGKLRRYFSWKNFTDPFRILTGLMQSLWTLNRVKPDIVFSKGGFVAVPVVVAAFMLRIPVVAHESDMTPGLANRLCLPFVDTLCVNFSATKVTHRKMRVTGLPLRAELFQGNAQKGREISGFTSDLPCLLIMGGSLGSRVLNAAVREALPTLLSSFQVIHLCGRGNLDSTLTDTPGYYQLEYASDTLPHLFAATSLVVSRAGANTLCELLALEKPHVLVPLSAKASRGDQIQNAAWAAGMGASVVIEEDSLTKDTLNAAIADASARRDALLNNIRAIGAANGTKAVAEVILEKV